MLPSTRLLTTDHAGTSTGVGHTLLVPLQQMRAGALRWAEVSRNILGEGGRHIYLFTSTDASHVKTFHWLFVLQIHQSVSPR